MIKVVCMGDSITEGFGLGEDTSVFYPSRLQALLGDGYRVFNQGVTSSCVTNTERGGRPVGLPYVKQPKYEEALRLKGDIYVLLLGTNDAQDGMDDTLTYQDPNNNIISYEGDFCRYYQDILGAVYQASPQARVYVGKPVPVLDCIWPKHQQKYLDILLPRFDQLFQANPGITLIDLFSVFANLNERELHALYQADGLHPNARGAQLIAKTVYRAIV